MVGGSFDCFFVNGKIRESLELMPLNLATTLRSSVVLKQVPTMEQYRCEASSQSLRRCLAGILPGTGASRSEGGERNGTGDTASTTQGLYSGIGTCEGKVVIPRSEEEA